LIPFNGFWNYCGKFSRDTHIRKCRRLRLNLNKYWYKLYRNMKLRKLQNVLLSVNKIKYLKLRCRSFSMWSIMKFFAHSHFNSALACTEFISFLRVWRHLVLLNCLQICPGTMRDWTVLEVALPDVLLCFHYMLLN
jgi:hypothetical protein